MLESHQRQWSHAMADILVSVDEVDVHRQKEPQNATSRLLKFNKKVYSCR